MSPDINGATTANVVINQQLLVAAGTLTSAGVDLSEYVGIVKVIAAATQRSGSNTVALSVLSCPTSGGTYTAVALPTFAAVTSASGTSTVQTANLDTRASDMHRYVQFKALTASVTATFDLAVVFIGEKQVQ